MYYKWIANHATYDFEHGGDLSFDAFIKNSNIEMVAYGDSEGRPRNQTGVEIILLKNNNYPRMVVKNRMEG